MMFTFLYASYTVIPILSIIFCGDNPNLYFLWPIENFPEHSSVSSLQDASKPEMKLESSPKTAGRTSHIEEAQKEWSGAGKRKRSGLSHQGPSGHICEHLYDTQQTLPNTC